MVGQEPWRCSDVLFVSGYIIGGWVITSERLVCAKPIPHRCKRHFTGSGPPPVRGDCFRVRSLWATCPNGRCPQEGVARDLLVEADKLPIAIDKQAIREAIGRLFSNLRCQFT